MSTKIAADRYEGSAAPVHDDMLGILSTGIAGANQWNVKNINDSLIPIGFLRNNSNDFCIVRIQSPHWRKQAVALDSIHIHYILDTAITTEVNLLFDIYWTWIAPGDAVPALTSWNTVTGNTLTLSSKAQWYYGLHSVVTTPAAPTVDGYGMYLLVRIVRGNGTYTGEIGILDCDAHAQKDRLGSINEASDT